MTYDAIIIGSGAGGSAAAYHLAQSGAKTLLLERGPVLPRDGSTLDVGKVVRQGLFKHAEVWQDNAGNRFQPSEFANLGGKTKWYGAALLRQAPHEFMADEAHQCPAWPISYDELEPWYDEAERLLNLQRFDTEPDLQAIVGRIQARDGQWRKEPLPVGLDTAILATPNEAHHFDGFASPSGLKADGESRLVSRAMASGLLEVQTSKTVTGLIGAPGNPLAIQGVDCGDGTSYRAAKVILAGGALHSPRLLAQYIDRAGLARRLPGAAQIGRNYKCHLNTALVVMSAMPLNDPLRKTTVLFHDLFPHSTVQNTGWIDGEIIACQMPAFTPRWAADLVGRRAYGFWVTTEDGSHPDNRIVSGLNGSCYPRIDYDRRRILPAETEHRRLLATLRRQLLMSGYPSVARRMAADNTAHACGTLIAGNDPSHSVVDRNGQVHEMANLHVADGSVMTRSGRVNPALTIYAWGLRVASKLAA